MLWVKLICGTFKSMGKTPPPVTDYTVSVIPWLDHGIHTVPLQLAPGVIRVRCGRSLHLDGKWNGCHDQVMAWRSVWLMWLGWLKRCFGLAFSGSGWLRSVCCRHAGPLATCHWSHRIRHPMAWSWDPHRSASACALCHSGAMRKVFIRGWAMEWMPWSSHGMTECVAMVLGSS